MCQKNKSSLEVSYTDLLSKEPTISFWIVEEPHLILPYLNDIAFEAAKKFYSTYADIHSEIYVRISDYPVIDHIRALRFKDLG